MDEAKAAEIKKKAAAEEARLQEIVQRNNWTLAYKHSAMVAQEVYDYADHPWKLPDKCVISAKGRLLVSVDPNISPETMASLMKSDASFFKREEYEHFLTDSTKKIIADEFEHGRLAGYAHLSQCIRENLNQTKADLIARYSNDRRIPFVVGAVMLDALIQEEPLFYYKKVSDAGYRQIPWEPRKVYIKPATVYPLVKPDRKKYYAATSNPPAAPENCPECGSGTRLLRTGYRGGKYHVCCTKRSCKWFLGSDPMATETKALKSWKTLCASIRAEKEGGVITDGGKK